MSWSVLLIYHDRVILDHWSWSGSLIPNGREFVLIAILFHCTSLFTWKYLKIFGQCLLYFYLLGWVFYREDELYKEVALLRLMKATNDIQITWTDTLPNGFWRKQFSFEENAILKTICDNLHISGRVGSPYVFSQIVNKVNKGGVRWPQSEVWKKISSHLVTTLEINARAMPYIVNKMRTIIIFQRAVTIPPTRFLNLRHINPLAI